MVLAAYRATRVIVADTVIDTFRERWYCRFPPHEHWRAGEMQPPHKAGQFIQCPWCVGFHVSGAVFLLVWAFRDLSLPGLWWPAVATGVGLIGKAED
jgi:hypothetical protein